MNKPDQTTVDAKEAEKFNRHAEQWWDPAGPMWPLHQLNALRTPFVIRQVLAHTKQTTLDGLRILDIGCGAGLLSEQMAKCGACVTGVDIAEKNINIARQHALSEGLEIDYLHGSIEDLDTDQDFDVVLNMEVVEHVANLPLFMRQACALTRNGGLMFVATINRTWYSWLTTILGAEYLLRWLPRGTHIWQRYVTPEETIESLERGGLDVRSKTGVGMNPLRRYLYTTDNMRANYMMVAEKT
ncbi:MAG: bifunctional 2-polyprenyl-6-hydroxyphenol methylase/3-demethylubiquinol 3-O-methyltransferase UbiG [Gammaproteobacteria bacterium]|nr:bifunctional 2-polyprenyl-6-hydroxyphenol methylase/3-demethylubiquinol 3-O-methyltransferase UbiG [Gammaproteobacteria bacterium]